MKLGVARVALFVSWSASIACGDSSSGETAKSDPRPLPSNAVARVGDSDIQKSLVIDVARASHISPREADDALVDDALLAHAAREKKLDRDSLEVARVRAAEARFTVRKLHTEAGPEKLPTDEEVRALTERHWAEVDHGEALRVAHVLVQKQNVGLDNKALKDALAHPDGRDNERRALAQKIFEAEKGVSSPEDFDARAKAIDAHGLKIRVEAIPPFVDDARMFDGGTLAPEFVRGAFAVKPPSALSEIIESPDFGWHVILVLDRIPAVHIALEERRTQFAREAFDSRAKALLDAHLKDLRARTHVEMSSAAEQDMGDAMRLFH